MGSVAQGIGGGALSGAATGMSIGGPWGALAGALIGGVGGGMAGARNDKALAAARQTQVPMVDPTQQWYLSRVRQQEQQMRAGTDPSSAFAAAQARGVLGQTQENIRKSAGANPAMGITGMLTAQNQYGRTIQGIGAHASQGANQLLALQGGLIDNIAERKKGLAEYNRNLAYSEYVNGKQDLNNLFSAGLALAPQLGLDREFAAGSADAEGAATNPLMSMGGGGASRNSGGAAGIGSVMNPYGNNTYRSNLFAQP